MAIDSTLGVRPIDTGFLRDINRQQGAMLEQLGAQVRKDVAQVQTNRQLQGFSQAVQGIDPTSPGYAQQIIGAISSFPLAAQSPLGGAVINQLGAAHSLWQQEQAQTRQGDAMLKRQADMEWYKESVANRPAGSPPPTLEQLRSGAPGGVPSIAATGGDSSGGGIGKVTSYGYSGDPYGDTASLGTGKWKDKGPTGAWENRLTDTGLAISPDIEKLFKANGIKEGDSVSLQLANGQVVNRTWQDRTMQDAQAIKKFGKPLRGRFDFYSPGGVSDLDGTQVVGFRPSNALGSPMVGGQQPSVAATGAPGAPAMSMGAQINQKWEELKKQGIPHRNAQSVMDQFIKDITRTENADPTGPIHRGSDGKLYRTQGDKFVEVKPPEGVDIVPSSSNQQLDPTTRSFVKRKESERAKDYTDLQDAEKALLDAGTTWKLAGERWKTGKQKGDELEENKRRHADAQLLTEEAEKRVLALRAKVAAADAEIETALRSGQSSPADNTASQPTGGQPSASNGGVWKLDKKTGIKWEVGSDGQLTGKYVPKA